MGALKHLAHNVSNGFPFRVVTMNPFFLPTHSEISLLCISMHFLRSSQEFSIVILWSQGKTPQLQITASLRSIITHNLF